VAVRIRSLNWEVILTGQRSAFPGDLSSAISMQQTRVL
jgi:hypothetical protein